MAKSAAQTAEQLKTRAAELRAQASAALDEAQDIAREAKRLEREERRAKEAEEKAAHDKRMFEEIGQPLAGLNAAQHGAVYAMAWEHGHASGFGEIEMYYGDFAELARKVIEAA